MAESKYSETPKPIQGIQVQFSDDLAEYIRTGVDPTGRFAQPPTRREKANFALVYVFFIIMFMVGLLGGGVGRTLFEGLLRLIQGG